MTYKFKLIVNYNYNFKIIFPISLSFKFQNHFELFLESILGLLVFVIT